jgi:hypothetical protein
LYVDIAVTSPVCKECVETNKMSITTMGQLMAKGYVVPGRIDDESGEAMSWVNVASHRKDQNIGVV